MEFFRTKIFKLIYFVLLFLCSGLIAFSVKKEDHLPLPVEIQEAEDEWGTRPFELYPGEYTVTIYYEADRTVEFYFCMDYGKERYPAAFDPQSDVFSFPVYMTGHSDRCHIGFPEYDENAVKITGMEVNSGKPLYYDRIFYAFILLAFGFAVFFLINSRWFSLLSSSEKLLACVLGLSVLASCIPLVRGDFLNGWDTYAHRMRIDGIAECVRLREIPAVIYPYNANGFGQLGTPYPQMFLYIPAFLRILRISAPVSMHFYYMMLNVFTAVASYICGKALFDEKPPAFVFAILYVLVPYRLMDIYNRCCLGEAASVSFVPFVFAGLYLLFTKKNDKRIVPFLVIGASGIINSHILSLVITIGFTVVLVILNVGKLKDKDRIITCLKAVIWILLINAFLYVPLGTFVLFGLNNSVIRSPHFISFTTIKDIFKIRNFLTGLSVSDVSVIGLLTILAGMAVFIALLKNREKKGDPERYFFLCAYPLMLILTAFTLVEFPWDYLRGFSPVEAFTAFIQFPYRFMIVTVVLYCYVLTYAIKIFTSDGKKRGIAMTAMIVLAFICVLPALFMKLSDQVIYLKEEGGESMNLLSEYFPTGAGLSDYRYDRLFPSSEKLKITNYEKSGRKISFGYETGDADENIDLPEFYYPGYVARTEDGKKLKTEQGAEYRIRVNFPANSRADRVVVMYRIPLFFNISYLISLVAALLFVYYLIRIFLLKERSSQ